jgi:hypothetical protein
MSRVRQNCDIGRPSRSLQSESFQARALVYAWRPHKSKYGKKVLATFVKACAATGRDIRPNTFRNLRNSCHPLVDDFGATCIRTTP